MWSRRAVLGAGAAAIVGPSIWVRALSAAAPATMSFIDELQPPDHNGLRLPVGFTSRLLAQSGTPVAGTGLTWHGAPDGGGVAPTVRGGWTYVSNAEIESGAGGVSALEFDRNGAIIGARTILSGTSRNCAGGMTPWGTWLSCEEVGLGHVYECDPSGVQRAIVRSGLGAFRHEAATVDPASGDVYLTEDDPVGRLYRFVPDTPGDLSSGRLSAARLSVGSASVVTGQQVDVAWEPTISSAPARSGSTTGFNGGEGAWADGDRLLFTTKGDGRVWSLDMRTSRLTVLHDCIAGPATPLDAVDNIVVHQGSGDVYIAEDGGNMQLCVLRRDSAGVRIEAFLQIVGQDASEITGPAFSPDGQRLYFSSQRGVDGRGLTYEVTGPFPRLLVGPASSTGLAQAQRLDI